MLKQSVVLSCWAPTELGGGAPNTGDIHCLEGKTQVQLRPGMGYIAQWGGD